jgi:hypothetical protein
MCVGGQGAARVPGSVSSCVAGRLRRFGRKEISINIKRGRRAGSVQMQRSKRQLDGMLLLEYAEGHRLNSS